MGQPEWPAAEIFLVCLSKALLGALSLKKNAKSQDKGVESSFGLMALDLVGKICSRWFVVFLGNDIYVHINVFRIKELMITCSNFILEDNDELKCIAIASLKV